MNDESTFTVDAFFFPDDEPDTAPCADCGQYPDHWAEYPAFEANASMHWVGRNRLPLLRAAAES